MKKVCLMLALVLQVALLFAQNMEQKLAKAFKSLLEDDQLKYALTGFYVLDLKSGKPVFAHNAYTGMAPASTQKLFTSGATFDLLGNNFRFKTELSYTGSIINGVLKGDLIITGFGDPTTGSWRWTETKPEMLLQKFADALRSKGITAIEGSVVADNSAYSIQPIPDGWIWQDIGNYYGAGCWALNWHENQYDLKLKSSPKEGELTEIVSIDPPLKRVEFRNGILAGKKGSGDNGYIYLAPYSSNAFALGTIPVDEKSFTLSGSIANGPAAFVDELKKSLLKKGIDVKGEDSLQYSVALKDTRRQPLLVLFSPTIDSINYWFLRKSINLYGEAFAKALAYQSVQLGSTEKGVDIIREHWKKNGIAAGELSIMDGSGLSPQNRVTPHALVKVLKYARSRSWFQSFFQALPEFNGMKMKSGSIGGSRAYAGYHRSKAGGDYAFAIIINNYEGSASTVVKKMYSVLDQLK